MHQSDPLLHLSLFEWFCDLIPYKSIFLAWEVKLPKSFGWERRRLVWIVRIELTYHKLLSAKFHSCPLRGKNASRSTKIWKFCVTYYFEFVWRLWEIHTFLTKVVATLHSTTRLVNHLGFECAMAWPSRLSRFSMEYKNYIKFAPAIKYNILRSLKLS